MSHLFFFVLAMSLCNHFPGPSSTTLLRIFFPLCLSLSLSPCILVFSHVTNKYRASVISIQIWSISEVDYFVIQSTCMEVYCLYISHHIKNTSSSVLQSCFPIFHHAWIHWRRKLLKVKRATLLSCK